MKILRAIFEESLKAQVNADGNVEFGFGDAEFTPVEILESDDEQYKSEFAAWFNDVWLAAHRTRLEKIVKLHGNERRFSDLCRAVAAGNVVPLVGSGMSAPSGLPLWRQFLHKLRAYTAITEGDLNALLDAGNYEEAVDQLAAAMGAPLFNERVELDLRIEDPSTITGAVRLLAEIFPNLILTTNLDDLLEHVYETAGHRLINVLPGRDIERYRQLHAAGQPTLLKLHGDCRRDDGRVLGVAEYDAAYAPGSLARESLALIYRTRPLLWLGCSLTVDRTVKLVAEVVGADARIPRHFAFLQLPTDEAKRVARERELSDRQIFPIWYDGDHDESVETLLVGLLDRTGRFAKAGAA